MLFNQLQQNMSKRIFDISVKIDFATDYYRLATIARELSGIADTLLTEADKSIQEIENES